MPARLSLQCRPGVKGSLLWSLEVEHAAKLKDFVYDDFEGPDAAASAQRLSELSIEGGLMHPQVKAAQNGFYHGERSDSFVFEVSAPATAASDAALLADAVGPSTTGFAWSVTSARDVKQRIVAHFPAQAAAASIKETMAGCGPVPQISAETIAGWRGSGAAADGLLEERPVLWWTKALLGRDYAQFRAALAHAEPLAGGDDLLYLLGKGDNGTAAVWLFDRNNARSEAVLISAGKAKRYLDEDAPRK